MELGTRTKQPIDYLAERLEPNFNGVSKDEYIPYRELYELTLELSDANAYQQTIAYYFINAAIDSGVFRQTEKTFDQSFYQPNGKETSSQEDCTFFKIQYQLAFLEDLTMQSETIEEQNRRNGRNDPPLLHPDTRKTLQLIRNQLDRQAITSINSYILTDLFHDIQADRSINMTHIKNDLDRIHEEGQELDEKIRNHITSIGGDLLPAINHAKTINTQKLEQLAGDACLYLTGGNLIEAINTTLMINQPQAA